MEFVTEGSRTPALAVSRTAPDRFLRFPEVARQVGLSRSTIWRMERDGKFPPRRQISTRGVGWLESEIRSWVDGRTALGTPAADHGS